MKTHFQVARLSAQQTLQDVAAFRRKHSAYSEIEGARRVAGFTRDPIENRGRDLMMNLAGPDKYRVELILMLMEKAELSADHIDFRKKGGARSGRHKREQTRAARSRHPGNPGEGKIGPAAKRRPQN
jgi:hypothetical protein